MTSFAYSYNLFFDNLADLASILNSLSTKDVIKKLEIAPAFFPSF